VPVCADSGAINATATQTNRTFSLILIIFESSFHLCGSLAFAVSHSWPVSMRLPLLKLLIFDIECASERTIKGQSDFLCAIPVSQSRNKLGVPE
jgi:hypothetical protein